MKDEQQTPLTEEEKQRIREYQATQQKFYEEHIPYLKLQEEFCKLNAGISQYNLQRVMADMKLSEIMASQEPDNKKEGSLKKGAVN